MASKYGSKTFENRVIENNNILSTMGVNTPEQIERANFYFERYFHLRGERETEIAECERLNRIYSCVRDDYDDSDPSAPKSFCPISLPIIEGQVAGLVEYNMTVNTMGAGPTDANFAKQLQLGWDFIQRNNRFKQYAKDFCRPYLNYGNSVITTWFDESAYNGLGIPRFRIVPWWKFYADGRIKDYKDMQYGEYCIEEVGFVSIAWARKEYGDEIADAIVRMNNNYRFDQKTARDDVDSFMLLNVWTRNNEQGNLQLVEMTTNPLILRESDPSKPYYEDCNNEYPFAVAREYPIEGRFIGFGDGRILEPIQRTVNKLFDEIEVACRFQAQARTYVDPSSEMDDDQLDSDPSHPIYAKNPNQTIRVVEGRGINEVVMRAIDMLINQAHLATRFSDTMVGMETKNAVSATQSGIMLQQGSSTISDKKTDISAALEFIIKYALQIALNKWKRGFWNRVGDEDSFEYVDFTTVNEVPLAMPSTNKFKADWAQMNPDMEPPKHQLVEKPDGTPEKKTIDFDVKVTLGEGLPNNRIAIHNVLLNLFQLQVIDKDQFAKMTEQYLGLDLGTYEKDKAIESVRMQSASLPSAPTSVNPASETAVGAPMGRQTPSATMNEGMTGTIPGGAMMTSRTAGAV